ncbi:MAG: ATP-binding cassette domain-containing protein [Deltaproteobacteria bacterium]|nr:ATP-binding cassette domain-containing protein [Deltaproteobacteria bacterium]
MIELKNVEKRFGAVHALRGVSFAAHDGAITGVLGPNGAGKTTSLRIAAGLLPPDDGTATVDGTDTSADPLGVRRAIGALPHSHGLYARMTAREHVAYFGRLHGLASDVISARLDHLSEVLEMRDFLDRRTEGFSQGQKLKVAIARVLVHEPKNIILDEPTAGLDVKGTRAMRALVQRLKADGRCVVFSSHVMQEVAALCDEVVVIAAGRVTAQATLEDLKAMTGKEQLEDAFVAAVGTDEGLA